jgi:hypothetical protein
MLDEDGPFVTYSDHVEALRQRTRERLSGQVQMMDEIARCIADGHRGNGSAEDDVCCQVCEEIQCDPGCAIAVHVEALRQITALATPETVMQANYWYEQGQRDVFALHAEWTVAGMCKPDCLPCQRLTELIVERSRGYDEGQREALDAAVQRVEALAEEWEEQALAVHLAIGIALAAIKGDSDE